MPYFEQDACSRLKQGREIILSRWEELARKTIPAANNQNNRQLRDAIPLFLEHLCDALSPKNSKTDANQGNEVAKEHGTQRMGLADYSLSEVLLEYKLLRQVILEFFEEKGRLDIKERNIVLDSIEVAMILAGTQFAELENTKYKKSLEKTEESNIALEHFAAVAAHDLKSPLATISSFVELLEDELKGKLKQESIENLAFINAAALRMRNLIDRLLEYSILSRHQAPFKAVDMDKVISNVIDNLKGNIEKVQAKIQHVDLPTVTGDAILLTQLVQNLIGNSLKFCNSQTPDIFIDVKSKDHEWLFSVRDNGIGFDSKYKEDVFLLYKKLHSTSQFQGTGIGLAACRKVAEIHHGKIWVDSEPGKGSTFYFTIPK